MPSSPSSVTPQEKQAAMVSSATVEIASVLLNLTGALLANSLTLWTNTLRVSLDAMATLFALYVIRRIAKGKNSRFDYGMGKWESLSALLSAACMIGALVFISIKTTQHFRHPQAVTGTMVGFVIIAFFACLNGWLLFRFWRLRRKDSSPVIDAQFTVYRNGTAASVFSLIALLGTMFTDDPLLDDYFDLFGTVVVSFIIFYGMINLFRQSLASLLDEALEESLQIEIMRSLAESFSDFRQLERVRSRRAGDRIFIEIFLEFEPALSVADVIARSARLKARVESLVAKSEAWIVPIGPTLPSEP